MICRQRLHLSRTKKIWGSTSSVKRSAKLSRKRRRSSRQSKEPSRWRTSRNNKARMQPPEKVLMKKLSTGDSHKVHLLLIQMASQCWLKGLIRANCRVYWLKPVSVSMVRWFKSRRQILTEFRKSIPFFSNHSRPTLAENLLKKWPKHRASSA